MNTKEKHLITLAAPGVEVVTRQVEGVYVTTIHGGALDGQHFTCERDPESQHHHTCVMARMMTWPKRMLRGRRMQRSYR